MKVKTHIAVGIVCTLPLIGAVSPIAFLGVLGSFVPDFDVNLPIKHRTITHSLLALFLTTLFISSFNYQIALVWSINYFSHLFLDSCTRSGVPWLYPFNKKCYGLKLIKTGESEDLFICLIAIFIIASRFM